MNKLYRTLLWTGLAAAGLAGCGDDVTVTEPPPAPPPAIRSVTVAPDNITVQPGATVNMTAAVVADAGATVAIAWSVNVAANVATIDATSGVLTIAAGAPDGAVVVTATATATPGGATGHGLATINVSSAPTSPPPTVSIGSVLQNPTNTPANLNAAFGQLDVVINLERNNNPIQRVQLFMDTQSGDSLINEQVFAVAQQFAAPKAGVPEQITLSFNSANFACSTTACSPSFLNGLHNLKVVVKYGAAGEGTASNAVNLTLANVNGFTGAMTLTGTTANATATSGLAYVRGGIDVSILPVIYTPGLTMTNGSVSFGSNACDASGNGLRTKTLTAPAGGAGAFTASFAQTDPAGPAVDNVQDYEFDTGACAATRPFGETPTINAVGSDGNNLLLNALGITGIRLDNRAPGAPTFNANPSSPLAAANPVSRQNSWINPAVDLAGFYDGAANPNGWLIQGTADEGVGGYTTNVRFGAGPTVDDALAQAASSTPTLPAPTLTNTTECAVISATDALGNESALPAAGGACTPPPAAPNTVVNAQSLSFGVDVDAPTIAFSGGLAADARINTATTAAEFQVTVADIGTVGNSGMLSNAAVIGTVQIRNVAGTACFVGSTANGGCDPVSVNAAPPFPLVPTTTVAANNQFGYITFSGVAQDAAGNQSAPVTRVVAFDPAANPPALTQALFNTPLSGSSATFSAFASDNFDLWKASYTLTYAGGLAGPIVYPDVILNTFNNATLATSNVAAGITVNGFLRQIENVTGVSPLAVGGQFKPTTLTGVATDQANNASGAVATAIPAASVTNGVSYLTAAAPKLIDSWSITAPNAATNISDGAGPAAAVNPTTVTLVADAFGPTATFDPPFTRVDFYALVGGNLLQIGTGTFQPTFDDGSAFGRRQRWTFDWTPGTVLGVSPQVATIYAIGVNANGDGLVTALNNQITVTNP